MPLAPVVHPPAHPSGWRQDALLSGAIVLGYAFYLFTSEYHQLYYDAGDYWQLGHRFYQHGHFNLLAYDDALRGYAYPLVNFACLVVRRALNLEAVTLVKLMNAALAGLLFGIVGPRLWQITTGSAPRSVFQKLLWTGLAFVFWRDYFNFSLSDFPALTALGVGLWLVQRNQRSAVFLAGVALALSLNVRPIYLASVPAVLCLLLFQMPLPAWPRRLMLFISGAALVLAPQWLINRQHFAANSPLVLSESKTLNIHNLYLQKLKWGMLHQKYESSVGGGLPTGQLLFLNEEGWAVLHAEGVQEFASFPHYLGAVARHPAVFAKAYTRHLFAGLDISHPTPYLRRWAPSVWLQVLNYSVWFWAALVALRRQPSGRTTLVLAAVLLPCLAVLPMSMEVRFLMPLHLLLLALVAFGSWPGWAVQGNRGWGLLLVYGGFVASCFALSTNIKQAVDSRFRPYVLPADAKGGAVSRRCLRTRSPTDG